MSPTDYDILEIKVYLNSLRNDKILHWSKLKEFADKKTNVTEKVKFGLGHRKHCVKRRKCWLPIFSISIQNTLFGSNLQVKRYISNQQFIIFHCDSEKFLFDSSGSLNVQIELSSSKRH